jgi:hypothetical protein
LHNVGRIYDRWDGGSVVWNGPRAIANQHGPAAPTLSRPVPGHGFVAGPDGRVRRLGDDSDRDRGRWDGPVRGNGANSPAVQAPPAVQRPPAVQTPWRRPPAANQEDRRSAPLRVQPPSFGGNERRPPDAGTLPPREHAGDPRQNNEALPRARVDGRVMIDRSRANVQPERPAPQVHSPQRIPPVAGVPLQRAPSQPQREMPPSRSFPPPAGRIEQPALANPGRVERPVAANPGHNVERPAVNVGRSVAPGGNWPQARGGEGRSNTGEGLGGGSRSRDR